MDFHERVEGAHRFFAGIIIGLIILSVASIFAVYPRLIANAVSSAPNCPAGFVLNASPGGGTVGSNSNVPISGVVSLMLGSSTATIKPINTVIFMGNGVPLGRAQANSSYSWAMPWASSLMPNGSVNLQAVVTFSDNTECRTNNMSLQVMNPAASRLEVVTQPKSWQGPMSFSFPIVATVKVLDLNLDVSPYVVYGWTTSIGNISPIGRQAQFSSGQTVGTGMIALNASYGGSNQLVNIPITVANPNSPLPTPVPTNVPVTSSTNSGTTNNNSTATIPSNTTANSGTSSITTTVVAPQRVAALQNNPTAEDCAVAAVGKDRFSAINSGAARPTLDEMKKLAACFATSNYILPSNFAPVSPTQLKELPTDDNVKINNLQNTQKTNDNGKKDVLKIQGKAAPNSIVIVYIFSDPLVLTTTADANGDWTYSLEDPIESGKHEVYAVVDKGNGSYQKSNPFSFVIGTAEAAASNPDALSLKLADTVTPAQTNRSMFIYIAAGVALIGLVLAGLMIIVIKKRKQPPTITPPGFNNTPTNTIISPSSS